MASVAIPAGGTGSAIVLLSYAIDGGTSRSLAFDRTTGAFNASLAIGNLGVGNHSIVITVQDAAGNTTTLTRTVKVEALDKNGDETGSSCHATYWEEGYMEDTIQCWTKPRCGHAGELPCCAE